MADNRTPDQLVEDGFVMIAQGMMRAKIQTGNHALSVELGEMALNALMGALHDFRTNLFKEQKALEASHD